MVRSSWGVEGGKVMMMGEQIRITINDSKDEDKDEDDTYNDDND